MKAWHTDVAPIGLALLPQLSIAIPAFTEVEPYRDRSLNTWRARGAHSLIESNVSGFTLKVNDREFGATLFAEAQHLLNHSTEQRAHLTSEIASCSPQSLSPSWLFVTLYYLSLYVAMSWTRAANAAIIYLDKEAIGNYCGLAIKKPGAGAFELSLTIDPDTATPYVHFKKCSTSHFHEAVWISAHRIAKSVSDDIKSRSALRKPTAEELLCLRGLNLFEGGSFSTPLYWQSRARNGVNYRPGFSYRSVVKNNFLRTVTKLSSPRFSSLSEVVALGERAKGTLRGITDPFSAMDSCIELLVSQTLFIETATEGTLMQLCKFHDIQSSAFSARKTFRRITKTRALTLDIPE
ncbi:MULTISPECIES: hypothetical protein [Burkholderiales]|uniref:hypothetical protein n=1 Tax=Burkholderiales TaxID=80840 RepID=UPI0029DCF123|nr:hypothetical protein [Achromobacter sp.]MCG2602345.1 hypothetical protein [Achromobacter sp.]MCG2602347.1 hypothetical protein [Achromobacter sp.]